MSSLFQANLAGNDFAQNPLGELVVTTGLILGLIVCRDRVRFKNNAEKHGLGRRPLTLARSNLPCRLQPATGDLLSLQRRE